MSDPHVEALHYRIVHSAQFVYEAPPTGWRVDGFYVEASNDEVTLRPRDHYASEAEARNAVAPLIERWQASVALMAGTRERFKLEFVRADVVDRAPDQLTGNIL